MNMGRLTDTVKHLIILNALFFIAKLFQPAVMDGLFALYYFDTPQFHIWQVLTHMFMHADIMHIFFNMFALYMFGSAVEGAWGRNKFLFLYFSAGIGSMLLHTGVNYYHVQVGLEFIEQSGISDVQIENLAGVEGHPVRKMLQSMYRPAVGASGAISGVLVAFAMLFPNVELMLMFVPVPVKAKYFVPVLVLIDVFSGFTGFSLLGKGIAHWAHVGGALTGFLIAYYWTKNSMNKHRWN